jgi:hypothetical protein
MHRLVFLSLQIGTVYRSTLVKNSFFEIFLKKDRFFWCRCVFYKKQKVDHGNERQLSVTD